MAAVDGTAAARAFLNWKLLTFYCRETADVVTERRSVLVPKACPLTVTLTIYSLYLILLILKIIR